MGLAFDDNGSYVGWSTLFDYTDEDENNQHLILLSTSYDSLINIYNEENPEESIKLKTIKGGHTIAGKKNEINCLDFSKILYSYATGSTDGLVVVWDFELSKINDLFRYDEEANIYDILHQYDYYDVDNLIANIHPILSEIGKILGRIDNNGE